MATDPTRDALRRFLDSPDDGGPVVMLNLLRFAADGGRAAYDRYSREVGRRFLPAVGGEVLYAGDGLDPLVAEDGQAWDAVLVVRYPNRQAFLTMVSDPEYLAVAQDRSAGLAEAVLQPTRPWRPAAH